ncbi:hypothetical protein GH714_039639 [Hevea brasiliensis]|uniref:Endonuclease/exonuclease/phosphatase domain-containing protein n=1 Tax=Hevea brasiliensis TaxID=3981 RepID=A0A6A6MIA1_HEVBR|nr:hypothetical protein GH714_039639 [Hevea brasiliensis]
MSVKGALLEAEREEQDLLRLEEGDLVVVGGEIGFLNSTMLTIITISVLSLLLVLGFLKTNILIAEIIRKEFSHPPAPNVVLSAGEGGPLLGGGQVSDGGNDEKCEGAANKRFAIQFKELIWCSKPAVIVILEHKAVEFSGGIWILWDNTRIQIQGIKVNRLFIYSKLLIADEFVSYGTFIYASHIEIVHRGPWEELKVIADGLSALWLVMGDFNDITS